MSGPEVTWLDITSRREDSRGNELACAWDVSVDYGGESYSVEVELERRDGVYKVTGWCLGEDDCGAPKQPADTLDDEVAQAVDEYMHRGRS